MSLIHKGIHPATIGFVMGLIVPCCILTAQAGPDRLKLYTENDSAAYTFNDEPTDGQLSNAIGLSYHYRPDWARDIAPYMPLSQSFESTRYGAGFVLGHLIFTPDDITISRPQPNDHPWASFLFAGAFWQRIDQDRELMDHVQLNVGLVGPSTGGEQFQKSIHQVVDAPDPQGWENQLPSEVTGNLYVRRTWRLIKDEPPAIPALEYELLPEVGAALGTVRREINTGVEARLGVNLPDDYGTGRLIDLSAASVSDRRGFSAYTFGRLAGRLIQHDLFLDGTEFQDSPSVERKPLVGELQVGFKLTYRGSDWQFDLGYGQAYNTERFEQQDGSHRIGMWTLSLTRAF